MHAAGGNDIEFLFDWSDHDCIVKRHIPISGQFGYEGKSEVGSTVAVGLILCPLVLLNKGEPGTIPVGAQIRALTISETEIEI